ncbi:MAG: hypothetical protein ACK5M4_05165 [Pseudorhodobacter sp.]
MRLDLMRWFLACLFLIAPPAMAESWQVILGDRVLGELEYSRSGARKFLSTRLNNTPLGVFNGTFEARSGPATTEEGLIVTQYISEGKSTRKHRVISVLSLDGRVRDIVIQPPGEATELSIPSAVPVPVLDPVEAFAALSASRDCPAPLRFHDGRRVVGIATQSRQVTGGKLRCAMNYRVTAGPGHLSPLRFTALDMVLVYSGAAPAPLERIDLTAAGFTVSLRRR